MTPERIARLKSSFAQVSAEPRALAARFYQELFTVAPALRPLFPVDLTSLQGHFEAALALVVKNLEDMAVLRVTPGSRRAARALGGEAAGLFRRARGHRPRDLRRRATRSRSDWRRAIAGDCRTRC